eukprot:maker-scaffold_38-snap-gene-2.29-mRNA-1 protein AED:0.07 eAED:0.07 QI:30/1/1/1/0.5/0.66/3/77/137
MTLPWLIMNFLLRVFSTGMKGHPFSNIGRDQVKKALESGSAIVIDVREIEEILASGPLQAGKGKAENIPLGKVPEALQMDETDFTAKYGFSKPAKGGALIFSCKAGGRSAMAAEMAASLGYEDVKNYTGGAMDWFVE